MTNRNRTRFTVSAFEGDFDSLPMRAQVLYGAVPTHPTREDKALAVSVAFGGDCAAAEWRIAAINWRVANPFPAAMDLRAIAVATTARILRKQAEAA